MPRMLSALPGTRKFRTICDVHREIYQELRAHPEARAALLSLLETAFEMGKKMNNKLRQYKKRYDAGWWERHRLDGGTLAGADTIAPRSKPPPVDNSVTTNSSRRKRKAEGR